MSWSRRTLFGVVLAMAILQLGMVWAFWGGFGANDPVSTLVFQGLGVGLAVVEFLTLNAATSKSDEGYPWAARMARIIFPFVFLMNLIGDLGATFAFTEHDAEKRGKVVALYGDADRRAGEYKQRIAELRTWLTSHNLDLPPESLKALREDMTAAVDEKGFTESTLSYRRRRLADLKTAEQDVAEIATLDADRKAALAQMTATGNKPGASNPQFTDLSKVAAMVGIMVTPDDLRIWVGMMFATVVRLVLAIMPWVSATNAGGEGRGSRSSSPRRARNGFDWRRLFGSPSASAAPVSRAKPVAQSTPPVMDSVIPLRARSEVPRSKDQPIKLKRQRLKHGEPGHDEDNCPTCNAPRARRKGKEPDDPLDELDS